MTQKIIYIAGPMTGLPEFNYPAFNRAASQLRALGHTVLNPVDVEKLNPVETPQAWDWYMRHAIRMVVAADAIALLPGWEASRGAQLEHTIGTALGLTIRPFAEWFPAVTTATIGMSCPDCDGFIQVGDRITRRNTFEEWRHARCPRTKFDIDPSEVCPDCFTVRATTGACSCA